MENFEVHLQDKVYKIKSINREWKPSLLLN